jgi:hypothetical protein
MNHLIRFISHSALLRSKLSFCVHRNYQHALVFVVDCVYPPAITNCKIESNSNNAHVEPSKFIMNSTHEIFLSKKILANDNSTYIPFQDFASIPDEEDADESSFSNNFPAKLHFMLSEIEKDGLDHIVSWCLHGRSFQINDLKSFQKELIPK